MSYYGESDGFGAIIALVILFVVLTFGGLFYMSHLDDQRAEQCIAAGNEWIDSNCLKR